MEKGEQPERKAECVGNWQWRAVDDARLKRMKGMDSVVDRGEMGKIGIEWSGG